MVDRSRGQCVELSPSNGRPSLEYVSVESSISDVNIGLAVASTRTPRRLATHNPWEDVAANDITPSGRDSFEEEVGACSARDAMQSIVNLRFAMRSLASQTKADNRSAHERKILSVQPNQSEEAANSPSLPMKPGWMMSLRDDVRHAHAQQRVARATSISRRPPPPLLRQHRGAITVHDEEVGPSPRFSPQSPVGHARSPRVQGPRVQGTGSPCSRHASPCSSPHGIAQSNFTYRWHTEGGFLKSLTAEELSWRLNGGDLNLL
jgi:hypothetical protein